MDNYITLAELRKTAEALLIKTNSELENKVSVDKINNQTGNVGNYDYKIASIDDKDLIVDGDWVEQHVNYVLQNYTPPVVLSINGKIGNVSLTATDVNALPDTTSIPSKTSDLTNDSGFITSYTDEKLAVSLLSDNNTYYYPILSTSSGTASTKFRSGGLKYNKTSTNHQLEIGDRGMSTLLKGSILLADGTTGGTTIQPATGGGGSKTITLPSSTGTLALTSDIPSVPAWALAANKPTYTASEVGATTTSDVNSLIATAIGNINSFNISVVSELPSSNIDTHTIYFLSNSGASPDSYDEYMYISNNWEKIGNTAVDLSGYVVASYTKGIYTTEITRSETGASLYLKSDSVSTSASGYYETTLETNPQYVKITAYADNNGEKTNQAILATATGTTINNVVTPTSNLMAANKKYVDDSISAISIPTKLSDLTNDSGFITSYTETDPTVPAWAKEATKPTYTASEVGAATSSHVHGNITNSGDITTTATIANGDRLVINDESASKITNSSITFGTSTTQYLANNGTWQSIPTTLPASDVSAWAKAATKPTYTAAEVGALPDTTVIPDVPSWALASTKPTYTASEVGAMSTSHAANAITATDISNWNAKVSDDKTWNGVTLSLGVTAMSNNSFRIPFMWDLNNEKSMRMGMASKQPTAAYIAMYDNSAYLNSTTPAASDNSTKVATTAYVTTAISNITYPVTSVNGQTGVVSVTEPLYVSFSWDETTDQMTCNHTYNELLNAYNNNIPIFGMDGSPTINAGSNYIDLVFTHNNQTSGEFVEVYISMYKIRITSSNTVTYIEGDTFWPDTPTSVSAVLSSGTLIATINGVNIYAPSYTDADGVSY